jgi:hypothetical protein
VQYGLHYKKKHYRKAYQDLKQKPKQSFGDIYIELSEHSSWLDYEDKEFIEQLRKKLLPGLTARVAGRRYTILNKMRRHIRDIELDTADLPARGDNKNLKKNQNGAAKLEL